MGREHTIQTNFTAGELTPLLDGRVDIDWYRNGTRKQQNMISLPFGPAIRRPGARFIAPAKFDDRLARLIEFEFSSIQAYALEAGDLYLRWFRNAAALAVAGTDAVVVNGAFSADIGSWTDKSGGGSSITHDAAAGRMNLISNGTTDAHAEQSIATSDTGQEHVVTVEVFGAPGDEIFVRVGTATLGEQILADFALPVGSHAIAFTPTASPFFLGFRHQVGKTLQIDNVVLIGSGATEPLPLEIAAPWLEADLRSIRFTQSADILYLCHGGHRERQLKRFGDTTWSLVETDFKDGPYLAENTTPTTLTPSAATGLGITITASATVGVNGGAGFLAGDVGRLVRIKNGATWGWAIITGITSTTIVTADVRGDFAAATAIATWRLGLYADSLGHPKAPMFHEQRLFRGGAAAVFGRYDGSLIGDFDNFTPGDPVADDDPVTGIIGSNQVNDIKWLLSGQVLFVGGHGSEWRVGSVTTEDVLKPTKMPQKEIETQGSADVAPVKVGNVVLFLESTGRGLHELVFNFQADGFVAPEITQRGEHLMRPGVVDMAYQKKPWSIVWMVRTDGQLIGLTYRRGEQVIAAHQHLIAGSGAAVESVAVIPGPAEGEVWLTVRRTIGGATKRYVERIDPSFREDLALEDSFFADSGLTYDGPPATVIGGAGHLEGELVQILADGAVVPDQVVEFGVVTLATAASKVHVGFNSPAILKAVRFEAAGDGEVAQGRRQIVRKIVARLHRSLGFEYGPSEQALTPAPFGPEQFGAPPGLFSGDIPLDFEGSFDRDPGLVIVQDQLLPLNLVSLMVTLETAGE